MTTPNRNCHPERIEGPKARRWRAEYDANPTEPVVILSDMRREFSAD